MGKNKGTKAMKTIIICAALLTILCVSVGIGVSKTWYYRNNGKKVTAIVTVVGTEDDPGYVESMYNFGGLMRFGETVFNGEPYVGQSFEAYVLPDEPEKAYRMPSRKLIIAAVVVFSLIAAVLLNLLTRALSVYRMNDRLSQYGIHVQGEAMMITRRAKFVYDCVMNFEDAEGKLQTVTVQFTKSIPVVGEKYPLLYCRTVNGKLICDLIEL